MTADHSELRRSLVPGMLGVVGRNERQRWPDVQIFEIGAVHEWTDDGPSEHDELGLLMAGAWRPQSWEEPRRPAGVEDVKGVIQALAVRLNLGSVSYRPTAPLTMVEHPGRTAEMVLEGTAEPVIIGRVGELHPSYLAAYEIRADRVCFATLDVAAMAAAWHPAPEVREIDRLPAVERDLAVIVGRDVAAVDVAAVIRATAGSYLARLELFDRYHGPPLAKNEVSLAYRLRFQPRESPLSEVEIEQTVESVAQALKNEIGGRIRSGS